jgi:cytochrome d ubiquinol oxidase subunit I
VTGLDTVPPEDRPPANTLLHWAFDFMVGVGSALILLALWFGFVWWRRRDIPRTRWFLRAVAISGVAVGLAVEAGWIVTEVGRQPWIVYEVMRTEHAVTGASGIWVTFGLVLTLYAALGAVAILVLRSMARRWRAGESLDQQVPYGPGEERAAPLVAGGSD